MRSNAAPPAAGRSASGLGEGPVHHQPGQVGLLFGWEASSPRKCGRDAVASATLKSAISTRPSSSPPVQSGAGLPPRVARPANGAPRRSASATLSRVLISRDGTSNLGAALTRQLRFLGLPRYRRADPPDPWPRLSGRRWVSCRSNARKSCARQAQPRADLADHRLPQHVVRHENNRLRHLPAKLRFAARGIQIKRPRQPLDLKIEKVARGLDPCLESAPPPACG